MGLPVVTHAACGLCGQRLLRGARAAVVATLYTGSGNPAMGVGLELDAIAAVVIGGTLLTGGVGLHRRHAARRADLWHDPVRARISTASLDSSWLRIAVGTLLLVFILLQRILTSRGGAAPRRSSAASAVRPT